MTNQPTIVAAPKTLEQRIDDASFATIHRCQPAKHLLPTDAVTIARAWHEEQLTQERVRSLSVLEDTIRRVQEVKDKIIADLTAERDELRGEHEVEARARMHTEQERDKFLKLLKHAQGPLTEYFDTVKEEILDPEEAEKLITEIAAVTTD